MDRTHIRFGIRVLFFLVLYFAETTFLEKWCIPRSGHGGQISCWHRGPDFCTTDVCLDRLDALQVSRTRDLLTIHVHAHVHLGTAATHHAYGRTYTHIYTCRRTHSLTHTHTHRERDTHARARTHTKQKHTHACTRTRAHIHTHTRTRARAHTHTHTYTHTRAHHHHCHHHHHHTRAHTTHPTAAICLLISAILPCVCLLSLGKSIMASA